MTRAGKCLSSLYLGLFGQFLVSSAFTLSIVPPGAIAQPEVERPSEARPTAPAIDTPFELPPIHLPPLDDGLVGPSGIAASFVLTAIRFRGGKTLPGSVLEKIVAPYLGRHVSSADLAAIRLEVGRAYLDRGYINSGAVISDQRIDGGVVVIDLVEGVLGEVNVSGANGLAPAYFDRALRADARGPLSLTDLRDRLQGLLDDPLIESINATVVPGTRLGVADLDLEVVEADPVVVSLGVDNHRSSSVGEKQVRFSVTLRNVARLRETLRLEIEKSRGFRRGEVEGRLPVGSRDTTVFLLIGGGDSDVIEKAVRPLDIESQSMEVAVGLVHSLQDDARRKLDIGLELARRRNRTTLGGLPFSFSPGTRSGEADATVIRFRQGWTARSDADAIALRSTLNFGIDALGATVNGGGLPDSRFVSWLGQAQWAHRLEDSGTELILSGEAQFASAPLLSLEKFSVGGARSVRGYPENELVRDNGWRFSLELRTPVERLLGTRGARYYPGSLTLAPFFDIGRAWDKRAPDDGARTVASVGLGVRWNHGNRIAGNVYYGKRLRAAGSGSEGLQGHGLHFQLTVRTN